MLYKEEVARIKLQIDNSQASQALKKLHDDLVKAKAALEAATKRNDKPAMEQWAKEVGKLTKNIAQQTSKVERLKSTIAQIDESTPKKLREVLRSINKELDSGKVKRGSEEWERYQKAIREVKAELKAIKEEQEQMSLWEKVQNLANSVVAVQGIANMYDGLIGKVQAYVAQYAEIQAAQAGVEKYTGLSREAVEELNEAFKQMDTRTPREQLNALAADAGRLGIQSKEEVLAFVEAADTINIALGEDLGEDAVKNIGKLAQLFGDDKTMGLKGAMLATGSAINVLAQSSSASEPYLLEFTGRMAGVARQSGLTQAQVLGFASVLDQSMVGMERGATALQNAFVAMMKKPQEFARIAGQSVRAFTTLLKTDANAAFTQFLQGLSKQGDMTALSTTFADLGMSGSGVVQTLSTLAGQLERVKDAQAQASSAYAAGTSVVDEAGKANGTLQAQLEKNAEKFRDVGRALGQELMPIMKHLTTSTSFLTRLLLSTIKVVSEYKGGILALGAAIVVYQLYVNKAKLLELGWIQLQKVGMVLQQVRISLIGLYATVVRRQSVVTVEATLAQRGLNAAMMANPVGLLIAAFAALSVGLYVVLTRTKEVAAAEREQAQVRRHLEEAEVEAQKQTSETVSRIRLLQSVLHSATASYDQKRAAIEKLRAIVPGYTAELDAQGRVVRENTAAIDQHIAKLVELAKAQAVQKKIQELQDQRLDLELQRTKLINAHRNEQQRANDAPEYVQGNTYDVRDYQDSRIPVKAGLQARADATKAKIDAVGEQIASIDRQQKALQQAITGNSGLTNALLNGDGGSGGSSGSDGSSDKKNNPDPLALAHKAAAPIKAAAEKAKAEALVAWTSGATTTAEYHAKLARIDEDSLEKRRAVYAKYKASTAELDKEAREKERANSKANYTESLELATREAELEKARLDSQLLTDEARAAAREKIERKLLEQKVAYARQWGMVDEHAKAEQALANFDQQTQLERQKQTAARMKALREQYTKQTAEQVRDIELKQLETAHAEGLIKEEEYHRLLAAIKQRYTEKAEQERTEVETKAREKRQKTEEKALKEKLGEGHSSVGQNSDVVAMYASITAFSVRLKHARDYYDELAELRDSDAIGEEEYQRRKQEEDAKTYAAFAAAAQAAYALVGGLMQSASQYAQAAQSAELARVNARYEAEIAAAGEGSVRATKLKEEQEAEQAKIKTKWAKRAMAMEMAQAVAATANNAILAYGAALKIPIAGLWMAPIAAAAAVAAGMLQIATIKKQHEAQAAGYYEGGYTGGSRYRRAAGVVHEGEFVANHKAVNNPHIRPLLDVIDRAQRNNTIGTLTLDQVRTATTPLRSVVTASSQPVANAGTTAVQVQQDTAHTAALQQLADALKGGITATVQLDGRDGLHQQYTRYKRLTNQ